VQLLNARLAHPLSAQYATKATILMPFKHVLPMPSSIVWSPPKLQFVLHVLPDPTKALTISAIFAKLTASHLPADLFAQVESMATTSIQQS
jgi:hypothetical protein